MSTSVAASYEACHDVIVRASRSFTMASAFLPAWARQPTWALYAMFRTLDDLVDDRDGRAISTAEAWMRLRDWRQWFEDGCPEGEHLPDIVPAFRDTMARYEIAPGIFTDLIRALEWDLDGRNYETVSELMDYAFGVAGTVGLAMCRVLRPENEAAVGRAVELGVAMQLTNIIRDVGEDLALGRLYLPASWLERFDVRRDQLERGHVSPGYVTLIKQMSHVANRYFDSGNSGIRRLPVRARPGITLASAMYRDILRSVRMNGYDNLKLRAHVSDRRKLVLATTCARIPAGNPAAIPSWLPKGETLMIRHQAPVPSTAG